MLILTGLLWQQVQPRSPDAVDLIGKGFELAPDLPEAAKTELAWISHVADQYRDAIARFGIRENFVTSRHFGVNPEVKPG